MKIYKFNWKSVRPNRSVQFVGKVTIVASTFTRAIKQAERKIRGYHPKLKEVPLKITEEKEE